jgi:uncharacterized protein YgbK (DUF1537 family)
MTGLRLAYYGDDFSGSADVMEVLAQAGVPTRLFLDPPAADEVIGLGAVGVAGVSRSLPTAEMEGVLRPVFERLKALGPPLVHYKVCSTFDSSPAVGSIGRAIDVGASVFGGPWVPLVVGAPALGRYVAFGNLFARSGQDSGVFRLDRHPTMSRHPVTPMREADLRRLLAEQTTRPTGLVDAARLDFWGVWTVKPPSPAYPDKCPAEWVANEPQPPVIVYDTVSEGHLCTVGRMVWNETEVRQATFAVGSSGLEYALVAYWRNIGTLPDPPTHRAFAVDRTVVVSGSCSPVTARQVARAREQGWCDIAVSPQAWSAGGGDPDAVAAEVRRQAPASVVVHAALGPDDPRVAAGATGTGPRLGRFLGAVLDRVLADTDIRRVCVAGGDTSGYVARELGVRSLEFVAPIAPGSPLCRMHAPGRAADGREVCFKGGQVGRDDFFEWLRGGRFEYHATGVVS